MNLDPFSKHGMGSPGGSAKGKPSVDEIFVKSKNGGAGRRSPPPEAGEPLDMAPAEAAPEPEKKKNLAKLSSPAWDADKVGFNEETPITVSLDLPEGLKHKTKVTFELFAKTPKGPERISQGEATAANGKATCKIPVYIPAYKDEDGNLMPKVEYYFNAKHSEADPLDGSKSPKVVGEMAERLIKCHVLEDVTFGSDKSFLSPAQAARLNVLCKSIGEWRGEHPDGKLAIFGHADAVGKEEYNKGLSERRARSVLGFLLKDTQAWEDLSQEEKWGLAPVQDLLRQLGHDPGALDGQNGPKTKAAVESFQSKKGLAKDGVAGAETRKALFQAFMDECNTLELQKKDFDDINGAPSAGCSEFNRVEPTEGASSANRRVAVFLLKSSKNFPIQYPCRKGDIGPCKKQVGRKGERRSPGFGCCFYDKLVTETAPDGSEIQGTVTIGLPLHSESSRAQGRRIKVTMKGEIVFDQPLEECPEAESGMIRISLENPKPGDLFTVSILEQDKPERIAIKEYEFHRYLAALQDEGSDFPRPEFESGEADGEDDEPLDGDTQGNDPVELTDRKWAGMPRNLSGSLA